MAMTTPTAAPSASLASLARHLPQRGRIRDENILPLWGRCRPKDDEGGGASSCRFHLSPESFHQRFEIREAGGDHRGVVDGADSASRQSGDQKAHGDAV